jgi:hypothetical protein
MDYLWGYYEYGKFSTAFNCCWTCLSVLHVTKFIPYGMTSW